MPNRSDILVIGSGIAGLSYAIKMAKLLPDIKITVLSKSKINHSNTFFAQGGIATVTDFTTDSFQSHIDDTLKSGGGLSNPEIVKLVVETAPERLQDLVEYGVDFTYNETGKFDLALEGGHQFPRVVHAFDNTGEHIENALIKTASSIESIIFYEDRFCIELLKTESGRVVGVNVLQTENDQIEFFYGKLVVLASGGSGQVYRNTTNPAVSTGDGVAMGIKAGAEVSNLNFVQFHPTALYEDDKLQLQLLTEAIRGFGAYLVNKSSERFLFETDKRGELATRDIVSTAIFNELKKTGEKCVYLDCRHLDSNLFQEKFPQITKELEKRDFYISKDLIPVVPAAHYQCGGLKVNDKGATNIEGLYAIGECSETGLHGVNRLASNSLLEALVFGHETAGWTAGLLEEIKFEVPVYHSDLKINKENDGLFKQIIETIKNTMSEKVTIASSVEDLEKAEVVLKEIKKTFDAFDKNLISEKILIAKNLWINAKEIVNAKIKLIKCN